MGIHLTKPVHLQERRHRDRGVNACTDSCSAVRTLASWLAVKDMRGVVGMAGGKAVWLWWYHRRTTGHETGISQGCLLGEVKDEGANTCKDDDAPSWSCHGIDCLAFNNSDPPIYVSEMRWQVLELVNLI